MEYSGRPWVFISSNFLAAASRRVWETDLERGVDVGFSPKPLKESEEGWEDSDDGEGGVGVVGVLSCIRKGSSGSWGRCAFRSQK